MESEKKVGKQMDGEGGYKIVSIRNVVPLVDPLTSASDTARWCDWQN